MVEAKILIADDSKMNQQILSEILGGRYECLYADDGMQALELLHSEFDIELVLLDINMPRKNGFEVLAEIRNDPELRQVPVVMLTTSKQESDVLRAYSTGACSFISKPFNFDKMKQIARHFAIYWTSVADVPVESR